MKDFCGGKVLVKLIRYKLKILQGVSKQIGGPMHEIASKVDEYARGMISGSGSTLFEELGLYYIGPVDGHNVDDLVAILNDVKSTKTPGPVLIHVVTEKGRGYPYAERAADKYHGKRCITNFLTSVVPIHSNLRMGQYLPGAKRYKILEEC